MWSKRQSALQIYNVINAHTQDRKADILVDLFTGWFAISEIFIKKWWKTINNDKNKYVMALLSKSLSALPDTVYSFIDKKTFKKILKNPSDYEDWYVWYTQCIWSFWNDQKNYMYGPEFEKFKKIWTEFIISGKIDDLIKNNIPEKYIQLILEKKTYTERRLALRKLCNFLIKKRSSWKKILQSFQNLQNLLRIEKLQKLKKLEAKNNILSITSLSYNDVTIPKNAVVYCDPPYKDTALYAQWWFEHDSFWEFVRKISKTNSVFVSEYSAPDDFRCIFEFSQKSKYPQKNQKHNNQPTEKIFVYNKK